VRAIRSRAVDVDRNRQRVLTELPLEPFVVGTHAFMRGEDEVEVVRDRLLRVEERCQLKSRAHVLGGPVVGVDVPVERFRRRRRIDLRHLRQLRRDLSRLVEGGRRPRHGRQHPVREVREAPHLECLQLPASLRVVASAELADDDDHVPIACFVDVQATTAGAVNHDPLHVLVVASLLEQPFKHVQARSGASRPLRAPRWGSPL
jgi:hypothetical protein